MDGYMPKEDEKLVVYDNRVNLSLEGLGGKNRDLFMVCAYKMKDKGGDTVEIDYREIINLAKFKHLTLDEFHEYLKKHKKDFLAITLWDTRNEDENLDGITIFSRFSANKQKRRITLKLNKEVSKIFTKLTSNFTKLDLIIFTSLKSKYSKVLYQNLCQYRNKDGIGFWMIPLEDDYSEKQPIGFKTLFGVPPKCINKRITDDIIKPAIEELAPFMQIKCQTILKGRKTIGYRFDFKEVEQKLLEKKDQQIEGQAEFIDAESFEEVVLDNLQTEEKKLKIGFRKKIMDMTGLDGISISNIVVAAETLNKTEEEIVEICEYAMKQDTQNLAGYILSLIFQGFSKPKKNAKKSGFNNFDGRKCDTKEKEDRYSFLLEKQLLRIELTDDEKREFEQLKRER